MTRAGARVDVYSRDLGGIHMQELAAQLRQARELVGSMEARDLRRGFTLTLLLLVAVVWIVSLAPLVFIAHRISRPIQELTAGLTRFAGGDWDQRLATDPRRRGGAAPWTRSTTWRNSCAATASGSST